MDTLNIPTEPGGKCGQTCDLHTGKVVAYWFTVDEGVVDSLKNHFDVRYTEDAEFEVVSSRLHDMVWINEAASFTEEQWQQLQRSQTPLNNLKGDDANANWPIIYQAK